MSSSHDNRCDQCKFWVRIEHQRQRGLHPDDIEGNCRRNAPSVMNSDWQYEVLSFLSTIAWNFADDKQKDNDFDRWDDQAFDGEAAWPKTTSSAWCGEFTQKRGI